MAWSTATLFALALVVFAGFLGYARLWEWRQPKIQLDDVRVASVSPYHRSGLELHWNWQGKRVFFEGELEGPVDFPEERWRDDIEVDDKVDAVVRKSFFGNEYDGLSISPDPPADE